MNNGQESIWLNPIQSDIQDINLNKSELSSQTESI